MTLKERKMAFWLIVGTNGILAILLTAFVVLLGIAGYLLGGIALGLMSFIPFEGAVLYMVYQKTLDELNDLIKRLED